MTASEGVDILERSTPLFRMIEADLGDLVAVRLEVGKAVKDLIAEHYQELGPSRLFLYEKESSDYPWPHGPYWGSAAVEDGEGASQHPGRSKWIKHHPKLTKQLLYEKGEYRRADRFFEYDRRAAALLGIGGNLGDAQVAVINTLGDFERPRRDEHDGPSLPPPLLEIKLPPSWVPSMGSAWPFCLRWALLTSECERTVARHNATPPHPAIKMKFEADKEHSYGRLIWYVTGIGRIVRFTDRVLRTLHRQGIIDIPESIRQEVKRHETWRHGLNMKHRAYVARFSKCRNNLHREIAAAREELTHLSTLLPAIPQLT